MKQILIALCISAAALAQTAPQQKEVASVPKTVEAAKPPLLSDAQKAKLWKMIAQLRELELSQKQLEQASEKLKTEAQQTFKEVEISGFQLDRDLNYVPLPKEQAATAPTSGAPKPAPVKVEAAK